MLSPDHQGTEGQPVEGQAAFALLGYRKGQNAPGFPGTEEEQQAQHRRKGGVGQGTQVRGKHATPRRIHEAKALPLEISLDAKLLQGHSPVPRKAQVETPKVQDTPCLGRMGVHQEIPREENLEKIRFFPIHAKGRSLHQEGEKLLLLLVTEQGDDSTQVSPGSLE